MVRVAAFGDGPVPPPGGARIEAGVRAAYLSQLTRRIGLAPTEYEGTTLREHLALPPLRPAAAASRRAS